MSEASQQPDEGQLLREHLFDGELLQLPVPPEGIPGFLPEWFAEPLPALVYPPLSEQNLEEGTYNLEINLYNIFYGTLRELAEIADADRSAMLRRAILEWNPDAALEVCFLARQRVEEDVETALLHYELAMELDGDLFEAVQDGGMCEYALAAVSGEDREERLGNAEDLFRRAIALRPDSGLSWWSLARVVNDQGLEEEAQDILEQFLQDQPEGTDRELIEEALRDGLPSAQAGIANGAVEPSDEQVIFAQAQALAFGEDPAQAVELLQPLAEAYPDAGEIWFVLGAAHRRLEDPEEAERCLRRAARLAPEEPFVWWELAQAYEDEEQWSAAENAIRRAVELDPENPGYLLVLGRALLRQGNQEDAEIALEKAHELVPDDEEVLAALDELDTRTA